jgi:FkbM family methyltransferase
MIKYIDIGCGDHLSFERPWRGRHIEIALIVDPFLKFDSKGLVTKVFTNRKKIRTYFCKKAIYETEGNKEFIICNKRKCSSLLKPNYAYLKQRNGIVDPRYLIWKKINVDCCRLDTLLDLQKHYSYDFIKCDAQGVDIEVLKSAGDYLTDHIVGIHVELWFEPMYKNMILFEEANRFLNEKGFHLYRSLRRKERGWFDDFLYIRNDNAKKEQIKFIKEVYF